MRVGVEGAHRQRVEELDAGDRQAGLDGLDRRVARRAHVGKGAGSGRHRLGDAGKPERDLDDDAERALGADENMGEVVAGGRFFRPRAGAQKRAVGGDDAEREHEILHRAVAHRVGARGAGRGHAAKGGVGARVDREEEAGVVQIVVELLAGDAGLDDAVEVLGVDGQDLVHARAVERHAAVRRVDVAFERGADAERHDRRVVAGANVHEVDHVVAGLGEYDRVRRLVLEPGQRVAVRLRIASEAVKRLPNRAARSALSAATASARKTAFALADSERMMGHGRSLFESVKIKLAKPHGQRDRTWSNKSRA